jgi:cytoskeletal protein RodZ
MDEQQAAPPPHHEEKRRSWLPALAAILILLLLAAAGYAWWKWQQCEKQHTKDTATRAALQAQVTELAKQLNKAKQSSSNSSAHTSANTGTCSPQVAITQSLKDNLSAAVSSQNYAADAGYMASQVNLVIAASEKGGLETPTQAVTDMDYLKDGTDPWNFNLPQATLTPWQNGFYKQYFSGTFFAGKAANNKVVSYGFDTCGKVNQVFMAADASLLN